MGCGKSTLGEQLANLLKYEFIDLDHAFEEKYHMEISSFFEMFGEDKFRKLEKNLLVESLKKDNLVLSTGGGTPCFENNMELIQEACYSIYIKLPAEILCQRLLYARKKRPIIQKVNDADLLKFIETSLSNREAYYSKADYCISPDGTDSWFVAKRIVEKINSKEKS